MNIITAARILGSKGGASGTGESKTRPVEHYQSASRSRWGNIKPEDRFWAKVDRRSKEECWEWKGSASTPGYGQMSFNGKNQSCHRIAYILTNGEITGGFSVCHKCDNRKCCNPDHLFIGTPRDNSSDMVNKGRSFHPRGELCGTHKLIASEVKVIKKLISEGGKLTHIAKQYRVSWSLIWLIKNGRRWSHINL